MTMRAHLTTLLLAPLLAHAQVRSDRPVVLNGAGDAERAISGLAAPAVESHAMNAATLQAGAYAYAEVNGDAWIADPQPPMSSLVAGTRLLLHAGSTNAGPVTLSVNGSAPAPVVNAGNSELAPGTITIGATVSVVYDGSAFQLISARRLERKPCPPGTVAVNELYCIETTEHDTAEFPDAANACGLLGMKVCSWGQFYTACTHAAELGITDMTGNWEWTDDGGNSDINVRVVGFATCTQASVSQGYNSVAVNFRCCFRR